MEDDLRIFTDVQLKLFHKLNRDNDGIKRITGLKTDHPPVFKARKFASKALKGKGANSGIRVIYAYFAEEDKIEFIEIYFKGNKENEDTERIKEYLKKPGA